jgi:predicted ferric reductase
MYVLYIFQIHNYIAIYSLILLIQQLLSGKITKYPSSQWRYSSDQSSFPHKVHILLWGKDGCAENQQIYLYSKYIIYKMIRVVEENTVWSGG